jgi:hypothetical protein
MTVRRILYFVGLFCLVSCAAFQPVPVSEKDLGIPTDLADKFAVKEANGAPPPAPAQPITPPPAPVAMTKAEMKAKVKKVKPTEAKKPREIWPNRWTMKPPFQSGDRVLFDITYFGATAGTLEMAVLPSKVVDDRTAYHIRATATTASVFSLFYRLYDVAETFMDQVTLVPIKFTLKMDESIQQRDVVELYDRIKNKVYFWSKWDHKQKGLRNDSYEIDTNNDSFIQDSVSAFFYIRTLPLKIGDVYRFTVSNNGKLKEVQITVRRKEKLTTKIGDIDSIVVQPEVVLDGVLQKTGDSFIWFSDDEYRSILKIDAKIKVGSIIAYLRELDIAGNPVGRARVDQEH